MNTKTLLIIGGVALVAYIAYKYIANKNTTAAPGTSSASLLSSLSGYLSDAESSFNSVTSWFGGTSNSSTTGDGNGDSGDSGDSGDDGNSDD